jgi:GNAT superfamily N-acetyltransferase
MIKPYENEDLEHCARLLMEAYNCPPWNDNWTLEKAERFLREFAGHKRFFGFTLWENGELIGAAFCREKTWWTSDEIYVEEFYISPRYQRRGYGKLLLGAIEDYIKERGLAGFTLLTNRTMPALEFYKKNDFVPAEHIIFMYKVVR